MTTRQAFDDLDIRALLRGPTDDERAAVAHRLCRRIDKGLDEADRHAAHEILRVMAADAADVVRRALAVTLKASPELPRDVALRLAEDIDSIASPVLSFSPVFTDEDLAEIVRIAGADKQLAVAGRATLGESTAFALAVHGAEPAVAAAVGNDNARFSERALAAVVDRFAASRAVTAGMAYRRVLPLSVAERLVELVGEGVRKHLVDRHQVSPEVALKVALGARERATVDLVEQAGRAADLPAFCAHLNRQQRLTASLMLRALASGHVAFVEHGFAELAGVAHHRAWLLLNDGGPLGLRALYQRAELPPRLLPAFRAGLETYRELADEAGDPETFQARLLERFLTRPGSPVGDEDVSYLLQRLDHIVELPEADVAPERLRGAA